MSAAARRGAKWGEGKTVAWQALERGSGGARKAAMAKACSFFGSAFHRA